MIYLKNNNNLANFDQVWTHFQNEPRLLINGETMVTIAAHKQINGESSLSKSIRSNLPTDPFALDRHL